ncbi:MAG: hypothetical protein ABIR32_00415 [Ilumatobacteraceae bacterium]
MTTTLGDSSHANATPDVQADNKPADSTAVPIIALPRRTIDTLLISLGVLATIVLIISGGLLTWGHNFSADYVSSELGSQNISFPDAAALTAEGRTDLLDFAGQKLDTGDEAEAYASYINGHLEGIADGATFADLGTPEREAKAAVKAATEAGESQATIDELQGKASAVTGQRDSLFRGETLRGLLLTAYAWSTVGTIAGIAAIGAFVAAAITAVLVGLGFRHHRRTPSTT